MNIFRNSLLRKRKVLPRTSNPNNQASNTNPNNSNNLLDNLQRLPFRALRCWGSRSPKYRRVCSLLSRSCRIGPVRRQSASQSLYAPRCSRWTVERATCFVQMPPAARVTDCFALLRPPRCSNPPLRLAATSKPAAGADPSLWFPRGGSQYPLRGRRVRNPPPLQTFSSTGSANMNGAAV